jgi:glycosyltransferase involved in cell wall biosynthesis
MSIIGTDASIISVGFQSEVRPYFSISNCLVFPSYREGFPNVVLQAGAMGLPSIVSAINGCNEIVEEGVNGTIVPVKNVPILLQKMVLLLEDSVYYKHLKGNSRTMITSRYDQHVVWQALLEAYVTL